MVEDPIIALIATGLLVALFVIWLWVIFYIVVKRPLTSKINDWAELRELKIIKKKFYFWPFCPKTPFSHLHVIPGPLCLVSVEDTEGKASKVWFMLRTSLFCICILFGDCPVDIHWEGRIYPDI